MSEKTFHNWENAKAFWDQLVKASARNIEMIMGENAWTVKGDFSCLDVTAAEMNRIDEAIEKIWAKGALQKSESVIASAAKRSISAYESSTYGSPRRCAPRDDGLMQTFPRGNDRPEKKNTAFWVGNDHAGPSTGTWKTPGPSQAPTPWSVTDGIAGSRDDNKKTRLKDAREMRNRGRL